MTNADTIIPFIYDRVAPFGKGFAKVHQRGNPIRLIDIITGEVVGTLLSDYEILGDFIDGLAIVTTSYIPKSTASGPRVGVKYDEYGVELYSLSTYISDVSRIQTSSVQVQGVIDKTGKIVVPFSSFIKRYTDGTFEIFKKKWNKIISTGKFYDKTGKKVKGKKKTNFED